METIKRVLRYLKGTPSLGLMYDNDKEEKFVRDIDDRRNTYYFFMFRTRGYFIVIKKVAYYNSHYH